MAARLGLRVVLMFFLMSAAACARVPLGSDDDAAVDSGTIDARTVSSGDAGPLNADVRMDAANVAGPVLCVRDDDCAIYVDYCRATCGECRPTAANPVARSACQPPPNVSCLNVCENKRGVCVQGLCAVR
ncbi:MAG TPA: hypothetical protein VGG33_20025 [Polyangia bacterium]